MDNRDQVEDVKKSFGRTIVAGDVIGRFYELFLVSHPDIKPRFADTDFSVQKGLLRQGVNLAIMFAAGEQVGISAMTRIRESHAKSALDISPNLYKYWKESMVQAVSELDPKFTDELARAWDTVLQAAIDHITGGYYD